MTIHTATTSSYAPHPPLTDLPRASCTSKCSPKSATSAPSGRSSCKLRCRVGSAAARSSSGCGRWPNSRRQVAPVRQKPGRVQPCREKQERWSCEDRATCLQADPQRSCQQQGGSKPTQATAQQQTQPHHGASQFKLLQVPSRRLFSIAAAALAAAITAAAVAAGAAAAVTLHTGVWGGGEGGAAIVRLKQSCRERGRQCNTGNTQPGMSGRVRVVQPPHMPQSSLQAP